MQRIRSATLHILIRGLFPNFKYPTHTENHREPTHPLARNGFPTPKHTTIHMPDPIRKEKREK